MRYRGDVRKNDEEQLEQGWRNEVNNFDAYVELIDKFSGMIAVFASKWDDDLGWFNVAKHPVEFSPVDAKPIHSAPYWLSS